MNARANSTCVQRRDRWGPCAVAGFIALLVLVGAEGVQAQYSADFEAGVFTATTDGVDLNGQDGFYLPAAGGVSGLVYTYVGNTLGLPANPTGGDQFVGCTGPGAVGFCRSQRDVTYGSGTGIWKVSYDIAVTFTGTLPTAQNVGSLSTQEFAVPSSAATYINLARWVDTATADGWNADFVWFDAAGTQLTESIPDPAFQGLLTEHWYRWETTFDLDSNQIIQVDLTDLDTGLTSTYIPPDRFLGGGAAGGLAAPSGFRFFAGSNTVAGNTMAFDNLAIEEVIAACDPVTALTCSVDCTAGEVALSWATGATTPDEIEVRRDGTAIATLPGDATSYVDAPTAGGPTYGYSVVALCGGAPALGNPACDATLITGLGASSHIVFAGEGGGGAVDSVAAIVGELGAAGADVTVLTSIDPAPCGGFDPGATLWVLLGTYPENHTLSTGEGQVLADHIAAGGAVYVEGGDVWGFDTDTPFADYDGIDSSTTGDGDDTFVGMIGSDHAGALLAGMDALYTQDAPSPASDWTDQLELSLGDLAGADSGVIWTDDMSGGGTGYNTGVFYNTDAGFGKVLCQSWEFGGYGGDQAALLAAYAAALEVSFGPSAPSLRRGDANGDGGYDISDAVFTLSALFVIGSPAPGCADAADSNDDGTNDISDAVYTLSALFVPGSPQPPDPGPTICGVDPTADALDCATPSCP